MRSILIKDTTREEREQIVLQALSFCGDSSCDMCSGRGDGSGGYGGKRQGRAASARHRERRNLQVERRA